MLDLPGQEAPAGPFARAVLDQLPLAEATPAFWAYTLQPDSLAGVFDRHRGRSFEERTRRVSPCSSS